MRIGERASLINFIYQSDLRNVILLLGRSDVFKVRRLLQVRDDCLFAWVAARALILEAVGLLVVALGGIDELLPPVLLFLKIITIVEDALGHLFEIVLGLELEVVEVLWKSMEVIIGLLVEEALGVFDLHVVYATLARRGESLGLPGTQALGIEHLLDILVELLVLLLLLHQLLLLPLELWVLLAFLDKSDSPLLSRSIGVN